MMRRSLEKDFILSIQSFFLTHDDYLMEVFILAIKSTFEEIINSNYSLNTV